MPQGCSCDDPEPYLSVYGGNLAERCANCDPSGIVEQYNVLNAMEEE